jgi:hypothetical protein
LALWERAASVAEYLFWGCEKAAPEHADHHERIVYPAVVGTSVDNLWILGITFFCGHQQRLSPGWLEFPSAVVSAFR